MNRIIFFACAAALLTALGCSRTALVTDTGGSSSEVVGRVLYSNGKPVGSAVVTVRRSDFLADTAKLFSASTVAAEIQTRTDDSGAFSVENIQRGNYSIEVNDLKNSAVLLNCPVTVDDSVFKIPVDTLRPTGVITGAVSAVLGSTANVFVQVYGLGRGVRISNTAEKFIIADVPRGRYTLRVISSAFANGASKIGNVNVLPGQNTEMGVLDVSSPLQINAYSKRIQINTSFTGANVVNDVYNFPALLRLRENNFLFNLAMKNGADIRFTKADSTEVPFEIERWDSAQKQAEIWIKIDTLFGNNASHYINFYWGNPKAVSRSDGGAVFDTANGFQGIWHFADTSATVVLDATYNHFNGIKFGATTVPVNAGGIGNVASFDGLSRYISVPNTANGKLNFPENGHYSLCAWVYLDAFDSTFRGIVSKGDRQYGLQVHNTNLWEMYEFLDATGWNAVRSPDTAGAWKYVVGVRDGAREQLYIDGSLVTSDILVRDTTGRSTAMDVYIGRQSDAADRFWKGSLDEVRISSVALNADWIRLCYMNQKDNDALVVLQK